EVRSTRARGGIVLALASIALLLATGVAASTDPYALHPGTAVLAENFGTGGNGVNTSSTTSSTNIFSPSVFVDYKRFGGEPTVTVDRYAGGHDVTYVSGPNGFVFPHYSPFFKSSDLGETFRIPAHVPSFGQTFGTGGGGGDSYQVVGQITHKVFFVDLPGPGCVTMNTSSDQGENWTDDEVGCGQSPGAIDDRQWDAVDELFPGDTPPASGHVYTSFINFTNPGPCRGCERLARRAARLPPLLDQQGRDVDSPDPTDTRGQ